MNYGQKRDYRKIDIFGNGIYLASTTWARTCREAVERFVSAYGGDRLITARFSAKGE